MKIAKPIKFNQILSEALSLNSYFNEKESEYIWVFDPIIGAYKALEIGSKEINQITPKVRKTAS